jgi:hypothetical protein
MRSIKLSDEAYIRLEDRVWDVVITCPLEGSWWGDVYETSSGKLVVNLDDDREPVPNRIPEEGRQ